MIDSMVQRRTIGRCPTHLFVLFLLLFPALLHSYSSNTKTNVSKEFASLPIELKSIVEWEFLYGSMSHLSSRWYVLSFSMLIASKLSNDHQLSNISISSTSSRIVCSVNWCRFVRFFSFLFSSFLCVERKRKEKARRRRIRATLMTKYSYYKSNNVSRG